MDNAVIRKMFDAVYAGDTAKANRLLGKHAGLLDYPVTGGSWLHNAAKTGNLAMAEMLLTLGADVNRCTMPEEQTPLISAIHKTQVEMVRYLLSRGADPNIGRTLIAAVNAPKEDQGLELVRLLVEHGADVNRSFDWHGDESITFTPLTWAAENQKTEIVTYLRSRGAVEPGTKVTTKRAAAPDSADEVVAYFAEHFGRVSRKALVEIVPTAVPVRIHVVPASRDRNNITLFTTGLSQTSLSVPKGKEDYRFCELFIQLPQDWKLTRGALADPDYGWPIQWLRRIAKYPHEHRTWLGGPLTIIANDDPPKRLAPSVTFTCVMLLADRSFQRADGQTIQLYRLVPLYSEERDLERRRGMGALMKAFDRESIPFVVDLKRRNVAAN